MSKGPATGGEGVSFLASIPPIQSAIKIGGDGSMRIQLDVPKSEAASAVPMLALTGCVLRVSIEVEADHCKTIGNNEVGGDALPKRQKWQSEG